MTQEQQQTDGESQQEQKEQILAGSVQFGAVVSGEIHIGDIAGSHIVIAHFTDGSDDAAEQYQKYVLSLIRRYDRQASRQAVIHNGLQLVIFIGAAAATILITISKIIPAILTGTITLATAIANYFKFGEHSRYAGQVAGDLALEYNKFLTKRGIYKDKTPQKALPLFMDHVESLIVEQRQRAAALDQVKATHK